MLAGVVVGPAERLEDRALARLEAVGPLEDDRGLGVVAALEQRVAALEQLVGGLALARPGSGVGARRLSDVIVLVGRVDPSRNGYTNAERLPAARRDRAGYAVPPRRRGRPAAAAGESVRPGIRPRLAIGRPSISLMSPVKSIGVAPLMYEPTANESTGAPASLK